MSVRWLVAKYVQDLRRDEPRNVGLILQAGNEVHARFRGEGEGGRVDDRTLRSLSLGSLDNYKAWIEHWRSELEHLHDEPGLSALVANHPDSNYRLVFGGELVAGEVNDVGSFFESLYESLVVPRDSPAEDESSDLVAAAGDLLASVGVEAAEDFVIEARGDRHLDRLRFHYAYFNGSSSLFRRVSLTSDSADTWERIHASQWTFQRVHDVDNWRQARTVALVRTGDHSDAENQLLALEQVAATVDVDAANAHDLLGELLQSG